MLGRMSVAGAVPDPSGPPELQPGLRPGLPGLPGSTAEPGEGPAEPGILDALLDDGSARRLPLGDALALHRALVGGDLRDLVAALVVPAARAGELPDVLTAADLGLRVLLAADDDAAEGGPVAGLQALDDARSALWDEDRLELVGRRLPLPPNTPDPAAMAAALLPVLASTVPTWITLPPDASDAALDVLAADGAEHVALDLSGDPVAVARLLRALVDRELTFRTTGVPEAVAGAGAAAGALTALCAVRAALNGAEPAELAQVLAAVGPGPLVSAVRRMSAADGAVVRAFLVAAEVPDATAAAEHLRDLGLLDDTFS